MNGFWKSGQAYIWLTGGALAFCVLMIVGLIGLVVYNGLGFFWPADLTAIGLKDNAVVMGQMWDRQEIPNRDGEFRVQLKVANRDAYGVDFRWIDESRIQDRTFPESAVVFERREWGQLFGFLDGVFEGEERVAGGGTAGWAAFQRADAANGRASGSNPRHRVQRHIGSQPANRTASPGKTKA